MRRVDLETGAGRIRQAYEDLLLAYESASADWNDPVSRAVFEDRIEPMAPVIKGTLDAIGRLALIAGEAQRDADQ
ncbi:hypothetical protein Pla175_14660 [Pirellulimonas nuda]|uniref:Uncharacterized protein n=1 Tax=Pirellulimonas nuda TaxID=2528009 RepID=A0A518D9E0_9BACT|nr:hypothetical protein [Pirellulimonas nuda]QDU88095.1 hypothetical protein Pla175_14660 [Pirellulimonas nuda]